jgi:DNA-binding ferritin-like protein
MFDTRNDLPANTRTKVIELLNARLADAIDLGAQTKNVLEAHLHAKR